MRDRSHTKDASWLTEEIKNTPAPPPYPDDKRILQSAARTAEAFVRSTSQNSLHAILMRGDQVIGTTQLPEYGETKIVTHQAKVTFVETSTKEKVE